MLFQNEATETDTKKRKKAQEALGDYTMTAMAMLSHTIGPLSDCVQLPLLQTEGFEPCVVSGLRTPSFSETAFERERESPALGSQVKLWRFTINF